MASNPHAHAPGRATEVQQTLPSAESSASQHATQQSQHDVVPAIGDAPPPVIDTSASENEGQAQAVVDTSVSEEGLGDDDNLDVVSYTPLLQRETMLVLMGPIGELGITE